MLFDNVQFEPNPPDKVYIVLMLIPYGAEYKVAWSRQYVAYTRDDAREQAKADFPDSIVTDIKKVN